MQRNEGMFQLLKKIIFGIKQNFYNKMQYIERAQNFLLLMKFVSMVLNWNKL